MWKIQDREAGTIIEECLTYEEAKAILAGFEETDKKEGTYTEDFYEIKNMNKFYHLSVGECVNQVYEIAANTWEEAKEVAFDDMKEGDVLVECPPEAVKENEQHPDYTDIDENLCVNYAGLKKGTWAQTPSGKEYWEGRAWYFTDESETFLNGEGKEFTEWAEDEE